MTIDLADYEAGPKPDGDYPERLAALQKRLAHVQVAHIVHRRRAVILFEGWDAGGKGGAIQRLTAGWDPRHFEVWPIAAPTAEERERHFLWRFWARLPRSGDVGIFDRSWYGRVLVERVEGLASEAEWRRAYDEINEFEAQQKDSGTAIIKIFLHVAQAEQDRRFARRLEHPWKRWKLRPDDLRDRARRPAYLDAIHETFAHTDTRWAPWTVIDGNNKKHARLAVLTHIAETLERTVPMQPPEADAAVLSAARAALGLVGQASG